MKLSLNINDMNVKELLNNVHLGNFAFNLEADFAPLAKALFDPSVAQGFFNLNKDILCFFEQNPDIIASYIETIFGGVAKGLINAVDKQLSPYERIKIRVLSLLVRMGLCKPMQTPSNVEDLKRAYATYRDGMGDGRYGSASQNPDDHYYQQGYDEGVAQRVEAMDKEANKNNIVGAAFVGVNGTQEVK